MANYTILTEEGAARYSADVGAEVDVEIDAEEEQAVVAAGWLEPVKKPKEAK